MKKKSFNIKFNKMTEMGIKLALKPTEKQAVLPINYNRAVK